MLNDNKLKSLIVDLSASHDNSSINFELFIQDKLNLVLSKKNNIGEDFWVVYGDLNGLGDRWVVITNSNYECCMGGIFVKSIINDKITYQSKAIVKLTSYPEKAASKLYIKLVTLWDCYILSNSIMTGDGMNVWIELLNRTFSANDGIVPFVYSTATKKEIKKYNINEIFSDNIDSENILVGLRKL
jgi:hypothetical protein